MSADSNTHASMWWPALCSPSPISLSMALHSLQWTHTCTYMHISMSHTLMHEVHLPSRQFFCITLFDQIRIEGLKLWFVILDFVKLTMRQRDDGDTHTLTIIISSVFSHTQIHHHVLVVKPEDSPVVSMDLVNTIESICNPLTDKQ